MVNINIISNVFDETLNEYSYKKLSLKHGVFGANIRETLKQITDSTEECKLLRHDIHKFYDETKNAKRERLIIKTNQNNFYDNPYGSRDSVYWEDDMIEASSREGLFYTGHNHPDYHTCFQSSADFYNTVIYGAKYSWTIGKDGLMIVKNTGFSDEEKMNQACFQHSKQLNKQFNETCEKEINALKKRYPNFEDYNDDDYGAFFDELNKMYNNHISRNMSSVVNGLRKSFKKNKVNNITIAYASKSKKK